MSEDDRGDALPGVSTREALADKVRGKSDEEIVAFGHENGIEQMLDRAFTAFEDRFQPERAGSRSARLRWRVVVGTDTWEYDVAVAAGACTVTRAEGEDFDASITLDFATFVRILAGLASPLKAAATGKMNVGGNFLTAVTAQRWFDD